jgi:hypothetical protein
VFTIYLSKGINTVDYRAASPVPSS